MLSANTNAYNFAEFDPIVGMMQIYCEISVDIQIRACVVLWSLPMVDPNDQRQAAQSGGCEATVNAMMVHMEEEALQFIALIALKVLSFDNIGRSPCAHWKPR